METTNLVLRLKAYLMLVAYSFALSGCYFYRIEDAEVSPGIKNQVDEYTVPGTYFVLHAGNSVWGIKNFVATDQGFRGKLVEVDPIMMDFYKSATSGEGKHYKMRDRRYVFQMHIFADEYQLIDDAVSVDNKSITKLHVMEHDSGKTLLVTGPLILASVVGGFFIFLLIACSCPHVYVFNGETYSFNNTLFTGATSPVIERSDYKLMPDYFPDSDSYEIVVKNEEEEMQYIDQAELMVVQHDANTSIGFDQQGKLYAVNAQQKPVSVLDDNNADLKSQVDYSDDQGYRFDVLSTEHYNHVYATFKKPLSNQDVKLVLRAKNNTWLSHVYKEFSALFGKRYEMWVKSNQKKSAAEVYEALKKEGIPLIVSVKNGNEWKDLEAIHPIGDVDYNTLVIPIAPEFIQGENIEIRLRCGFMFWDLDYVALDTTPQTSLTALNFSASTIESEKLIADDQDYKILAQGDSVRLVFNGLPVSSQLKRTVILHSNGYYLPGFTYEGKPNKEELEKFKEGGELANFSKRLYQHYFGEMKITVLN